MCCRPKKVVFFLGLGRFWTFCPLRDLWPLRADCLTGRPLTGRLLTGKPLRGGFLRETPLITGKLTGRLGLYGKPLTRRDRPYGKGRSLTGRPGSLTGPSQRRTTKRLTERQGPYGKPLYEEERTLREGPVPDGKGRGPLRVLHREGRRRGLREGRALTGSPLRGGTVLTGRAGPYGKGRGPLRGWVPSQRRTTFIITGKLTGSYGEGLYQNWAGISACVL